MKVAVGYRNVWITVTFLASVNEVISSCLSVLDLNGMHTCIEGAVSNHKPLQPSAASACIIHGFSQSMITCTAAMNYTAVYKCMYVGCDVLSAYIHVL